MVEVSFLGGCREVGNTGFLLNNGTERVLFDYGTNVQTGESPMDPGKQLDAVFLSHPHLDHSGNLPKLYRQGYLGPVWFTHTCFDLSSLLLRDSLKVQTKRGMELQFFAQDIKRLEKLARLVKLGQYVKLKNSSVRFLDAGHVPGSASLLYESQGKKILYTGDIKFVDSVMMKGAYTDYKDIDLLITETTYSYKNHPDRAELSDKLREIIQHTVYNNGTVLIPSFAIGRTQEMLCLAYDLGFPLYLDGMGIEATKRVLNHPESVRCPKRLKHAFKKAKKILKARDRPKVLKKPCIVICTAGMMQGGPIAYYMSKLHQREDCTLIMNGYQVDGTPGRILFETGRYVYEDLDVKPKMKIEFMDFSAHCGRDNLIKFIEKVNPGKVAMVHGERTEEFAMEMKEKGIDAFSPKKGDKIQI